MTLPQTNATLTRVTGGGGSEDWDQSAGAGAELWAGSSPAYFRSVRERTFGSTDDVLIRRTLIVETGLRTWAEGETVTFKVGGIEKTGKVQAIEEHALDAHPLQTTRLTLEES
jgi:hypothetical protein